MKKLWRIFIGVLAVTGLLTLLLMGTGIYAAIRFASHEAKPSLPKEIVLELDLNGGVADLPPKADPLHGFAKSHGPLRLQDTVDALGEAAKDPRVKALSLRLGGSALGLANAQEIRDAILAFKHAGKHVHAFAESFGEMGGGSIDVFIASAADEIWMQPSGDMGLVGFSAEMPFLKGSLDLLGIKPEFQRRHEFKSAVETFTETGMTAESKSSMNALLGSFLSQLSDGIAAGRKLAKEKVRQLIDDGPHGAQEALDAKLVDKLGYADEADEALSDKFPNAETVDVGDYLSAIGSPHAKGDKKIVVVHASGPVVGGQSDEQPFDGGKTIASDDIVGALQDAADDDQVAAIILRIDSPGGSYLASDTIWRAVGLARDAGKPVIASIGDMAASGGYFIAMAADRIVAEPGAITGSIGVFAGKMVFSGLWAKLGVSFDQVDAGANAGLLSPNRPFTPEQKAKLSRMLDRIYADFTTKAGEGRHMDGAAMDKVARGRVFTGEQALQVKLIDALGGFNTALLEAKRAAKLPDDAKIQLVYLPKPPNPLERLAAILESGNLPLGIESLARMAARLDAIGQSLGLAETRGAARLPPVKVRN
jgi:protease-4